MKNVLVFNIGNSDVFIREPVEILGKMVSDYIPSKIYRSCTQYILDHENDFTDKLSFPIIQPCLQYLKAKNIFLHEIRLIATDQYPAHASDTIYATKLIRSTLNRWKQTKEWEPLLKPDTSIKMHSIQQNPSDLDNMWNFYNTLLADWGRESQDRKYYLSVTGGTQAMNAMLLLGASNHIGGMVEYLYLPNGAKQPISLNTGKRLLMEHYLSSIKGNVKIYEYYSALRFLEKNSDAFSAQKLVGALKKLLSFAHHRISFVFAKAVTELNEAIQLLQGDLREDAIRLRDDVLERHSAYLVAEIFWNARMLYEKGQYIDFCGRIFRFLEESLRHIIQNVLGIPLENKDNRGEKIQKEWLNQQPQLAQFLKSGGIDIDRSLTRMSMERIIEYYTQHGREDWQEILSNLRTFNALAELRNKSVMAHGFGGVSEEDIFEYMRGNLRVNRIDEMPERIFANLREIYVSLYQHPEYMEKNIYQHINTLIDRVLEKIRESE